MEWINAFEKSLQYIEKNLLEDIDASIVSNYVGIDAMYFQKAFCIFTNYSLSEYIRNRRLYKAALEIRSNKSSITDIAYKYKYETPEAFTKAFTRFHGFTPSRIRNDSSLIKVFLPLKINVSIDGGYKMDLTIEEMESLTIVGFYKDIPYKKGYELCPKFWDEYLENYCSNKEIDPELKKFIKDNSIGEFAACVDFPEDGFFRYIIGGKYVTGNIPDNMTTYVFKKSLWAKFKCIGPLPGALQALNTKIWDEWVPNNQEYKLLGNANMEWYSMKNTDSDDYESGIWLPIIEK